MDDGEQESEPRRLVGFYARIFSAAEIDKGDSDDDEQAAGTPLQAMAQGRAGGRGGHATTNNRQIS